MKIESMLTKYNHDVRSNRKIEYIVIHWVGAVSSAKANGAYSQSGDHQAGAHYFVDDYGIIKSIRERDVAWSVGSNGYLDQGSPYAKYGHTLFGKCTNENSISIEMCCKKKNGRLYITDKTIENTAELVQAIQKRIDIPDSRVIRHFDVNGKICPMPYVHPVEWHKLHAVLVGSYYRVKTKCRLIAREEASLNSKKTRNLEKGKVYAIVKRKGDRGQLINGDWITATEKFIERL